MINIEANGLGVTNKSVSSAQTTLPTLDTTVGNAYDLDLHVTGTFSFDKTSSIPGETAYAAVVSGRVNHPIKGNKTTAEIVSNQVLVYTVSDDSTNLVESFNGEAKRLPSADYNAQADVTDAEEFFFGLLFNCRKFFGKKSSYCFWISFKTS
mgnify:CR=1 FL=1